MVSRSTCSKSASVSSNPNQHASLRFLRLLPGPGSMHLDCGSNENFWYIQSRKRLRLFCGDISVHGSEHPSTNFLQNCEWNRLGFVATNGGFFMRLMCPLPSSDPKSARKRRSRSSPWLLGLGGRPWPGCMDYGSQLRAEQPSFLGD